MLVHTFIVDIYLCIQGRGQHQIAFCFFHYYLIIISGIVGEVDEANDAYYIWTHKKFDLGYNGNQIVDVNLTSEARQKLELGAKIKFTYEANWKKSNVKFEDRFDKYLDPNFFQHRVSFLKIVASHDFIRLDSFLYFLFFLFHVFLIVLYMYCVLYMYWLV